MNYIYQYNSRVVNYMTIASHCHEKTGEHGLHISGHVSFEISEIGWKWMNTAAGDSKAWLKSRNNYQDLAWPVVYPDKKLHSDQGWNFWKSDLD